MSSLTAIQKQRVLESLYIRTPFQIYPEHTELMESGLIKVLEKVTRATLLRRETTHT